MEQNNLPVFAKKVWKLVRVLYFMLRKGISKSKILLDLSKMMKRGKLAGKLHNLNWATPYAAANLSPLPGEYEFSCSNKHSSEDLDMTAVMKAMEMMIHETASPALPGFGRCPVVRQLRVTDSPFPVSSVDEDSHVVDEAAEKFISRFYNDLRRQNTNASSFGSSY